MRDRPLASGHQLGDSISCELFDNLSAVCVSLSSTLHIQLCVWGGLTSDSGVDVESQMSVESFPWVTLEATFGGISCVLHQVRPQLSL